MEPVEYLDWTKGECCFYCGSPNPRPPGAPELRVSPIYKWMCRKCYVKDKVARKELS